MHCLSPSPSQLVSVVWAWLWIRLWLTLSSILNAIDCLRLVQLINEWANVICQNQLEKPQRQTYTKFIVKLWEKNNLEACDIDQFAKLQGNSAHKNKEINENKNHIKTFPVMLFYWDRIWWIFPFPVETECKPICWTRSNSTITVHTGDCDSPPIFINV